MNILFLIFHGLSPVSGISKKILYQLEGLRANGHRVTFCHYNTTDQGHKARLIDEHVLEDFGNSRLAPLKKRMCYGSIYRHILENHIEFVYVRSYHNANPFTIGLYQKLKKAGVKVVMEIPTYPYDQEYLNVPLFWRLELSVDKIFRTKMAKTLDAIVTFTDNTTIFGQKTIRISNGIDFNAIPVKQRINDTSQEIHLLGVAEVHYWHAYDRIITGLGEYYRTHPDRKAYLHIVGGLGMNEQHLFDHLIHEYHLEDKVFLYGQKQGDELGALFEQCDFAIGSLGRHRSGIDKIKTLKNREYAARGIPFIYSETDEDFERMPYILKASADDTPIDIARIMDFYDSLSLTPQEIRDTIRHLSWKEQMQQVIDQSYNLK